MLTDSTVKNTFTNVIKPNSIFLLLFAHVFDDIYIHIYNLLKISFIKQDYSKVFQKAFKQSSVSKSDCFIIKNKPR